MYSADYVSEQIPKLKESNPVMIAAWKTALLCVGWGYVFGARGCYCTPANRRSAYNSHGADHPTIKTKCKNFEGDGTCSGCQWLPGGKKTRVFDCRGFTYWILKQVYNWELKGAGATSQWNTASNWKAKGEIATMPTDVLCCLFVKKGNTMSHTGFGYGNQTVECSSGVQHFTTRNKKWTHWAVPVCIDGSVTPVEPTKPTLKKGSKGSDVKELQNLLIKKGYSLPKYGADGSFGNETLSAVKAFQKDYNLPVNGVVDSPVWDALENAKPIYYSLTIPHLSKSQADALAKQYPNATKTEEKG